MSSWKIAAVIWLCGAAGCYSQDVVLSDPPENEDDSGTPVRSSCHEGTDWSGFPGCDSIRAESHFCLALAGAGLRLIGLDSHEACAGPSFDESSCFDCTSSGWIEDHLYVCDGAGSMRMTAISLVDGSTEVVPRQCIAVTESSCELLSMPGPGAGFDQYADFDAVRDGEATWSYQVDGIQASRLAAQGSRVYTAWHSTDHVEPYSLPDGVALDSIALEGFDGWVHGMSVTEDGLLVIAQRGVRVFDATTGEALDSFELETPVVALTCVVGGEGQP